MQVNKLFSDNPVYRYGSIGLSDDFFTRPMVARYSRYYSLRSYEYPVRHPDLQKLVGSYPTTPVLPDWWSEALLDATFPLRYFLIDVTPEEYVKGIVDEQRFKLFRTTLKEDTKKLVPTSPKISAMLKGNKYENRFTSRGQSYDEMPLVHVTVNPEDIFYMSNGAGWNSCQHPIDGSYRSNLRGSMFDCSMAMAYVLKPGETIYKNDSESQNKGSVVARCLLRACQIPVLNANCIMIDRIWGNDLGLQKQLFNVCSEVIEKAGFIPAYSARTYSDSYFDHYNTSYVTVALTTHNTCKPSEWEWGYQDTLGTSSSTTVQWNGKSYELSYLAGLSYVKESVLSLN